MGSVRRLMTSGSLLVEISRRYSQQAVGLPTALLGLAALTLWLSIDLNVEEHLRRNKHHDVSLNHHGSV